MIKVKVLKQKRIPKFSFYEPRKNLPGKAAIQKNDESIFASLFTRSYMNQFGSLHHKSIKTSVACAKELRINGFGIADFVTVAWNEARLYNKISNPRQKNSGTCPTMSFRRASLNSETFIKAAKPTVRAFEFKMSNWRRALMQASRYKFFSNVSIVVLPIEKCTSPLRYLDTFKKIRVGLWGFDKNTNKIFCFHSPKPKKPIDSRHYLLTIEFISTVSKALPIYGNY